jgi:predicted nuclease of predicted toxin-antitoxin system
MLRFAADENFNNHILDGLRRRKPDLDLVRVQDVGLSGAADSDILAWAAGEGRILLTHDLRTIVPEVERLLRSGKPVAGVLAVGRKIAVSTAIEEILLVAECSLQGDWAGTITYLPLR